MVEFASETGLRRGEVFHLTWASVDLPRSAIRVEMQMKSRLANGRHWKPKHGKHREVPLSTKAKAILERLLAGGPRSPDEEVFPNHGGCPYERMDEAPVGSGQAYFPLAVQAAEEHGQQLEHGPMRVGGLGGKVNDRRKYEFWRTTGGDARDESPRDEWRDSVIRSRRSSTEE